MESKYLKKKVFSKLKWTYMDVRTGEVCRKCGWEVSPAAGRATWLEGIVQIDGLEKLE